MKKEKQPAQPVLKFKVGDTVYLASPYLVKLWGMLCTNAEKVWKISQEIQEYHISNTAGTWPPEYVFATKEEAKAAGRGFVETVIQEIQQECEDRIASLRSMLNTKPKETTPPDATA